MATRVHLKMNEHTKKKGGKIKGETIQDTKKEKSQRSIEKLNGMEQKLLLPEISPAWIHCSTISLLLGNAPIYLLVRLLTQVPVSVAKSNTILGVNVSSIP